MAIVIDDELNILIDGKEVYFTLHIREEIDKYEKDTMFVCEIVDRGEKKMVSKN
ncbi:MAG: hypothetical protein HYW27_01265, partial [Candidatus Aenigmarchaeota archaeon]|nr:hypothetical protein [Candidatus Aenigmarchaeota archaeon]